MGGFNFKEERVARKLNGIAMRPIPGMDSIAELLPLSIGWIYKAPSGGIPARSGVTVGKATCTLYFINDSDQLTKATLDGSDVTHDVYNLSTIVAAEEDDRYLIAFECSGKPVAVWEDCG